MAFESFGSDIAKGNTADYSTATTWVSVGCVTSITPPSMTVEKVEVPVCLNAASRTKEVRPGATTPGEASYTIQFSDGDVDDAIAALGVFGSYRIKFGDSTKGMVFNGFFSGFSVPELNENGFIQVTCQIQMSGDPDEVSGLS